MAAITAEGRAELVALYLTMFGNAPSTQKLAEMVVAREAGATVFQVAASLATDPSFALVASKDAESFATYLADALLASDIPASARAWSIDWVVTQVSGTKSKSQVIAEAVQAIRATTNTNYASSQAELTADVTSALDSIDNPVVSGQIFTLTTNVDLGADFTGGNGSDVFYGSIIGDLAQGTTLNPGDALVGGGGNDILNLTVSGDPAASTYVVQTNGIETYNIGNYDTDATTDATFNLSSVTGLTAVNVTGGNGDTVMTGLTNKIALGGSNATGSISMTYGGGVLIGTADVQALSLTSFGTVSDSPTITVGDASFGVAETLAITATGTNYATLAATNNHKTITIDGAGGLTLDFSAEDTITKIDASEATGSLTYTNIGASKLTLVGGAGADTLRISGTTIDQYDDLNGGEGADTLQLTAALTTAIGGSKVAGFENLRAYVDNTTDGTTTFTQDVSLLSGVTSVGISRLRYLDGNDGTADAGTMNATFTNMAADQTISISGVASAGDADDNGAVTANATFSLASDTAADVGTISIGSAFAAGVSAGANNALTFNLNANDYETLTLNNNGSANSSVTINALSVSDATSLTINATRALTITTLTAGNLTVLDASGSAENVTISSALSLASTVTGGAGNDTFTGSTFADVINGGAGNDTIDGGGGNDVISGGDGDDTFLNAAANIDASASATLSVSGGAGNDTFVIADFSDLTSATTLDGGDGTDTLSFTEDANHDFTASSTLFSNVSNIEVLSFDGLTGARVVTINDGNISGGAVTIALGTGSAGNNTFNMSGVLSSSNVVTFNELATGVNTTYSVANAKDIATMGDGDDTFAVSNVAFLSATDVLKGGAGSDTLQFTSAADSTVTVAQLAGVSSVENISVATDAGGNYSITLNDAVVGAQITSGNTFSVSRAAGDTNSATLKVDGSAVSSAYKLSISGQADATSSQTLIGGGGDDTITTGLGADSLTGGAGNDTFVLLQVGSGYRITDFNPGGETTATDKISVDSTTLGVDAPRTLDTADFNQTVVWSTGAITAAVTATTDLVIFTNTGYANAAAVETAVEDLDSEDVTQDFFIVYQDTLGQIRLALAESDGAADSGNDFTVTDLAILGGVTLSTLASNLTTADFIVA